jgi:1-acyl-sn-glycerol-3-phosphate acyltransferase
MQYQGQLQLRNNGNYAISNDHSPNHSQLRQATDTMLYWLGTSAVHLFAHSLLDMDVMPASPSMAPLPAGPKIFAANHPTTLDPFLLLTLAPEEMSILVTGGAFTIPLLGRYLRRIGHVPVVRGRGRESFAEAQQLLDGGRSVGIFPEGSLSPAIGDFHRPHTGVARLAMLSGVPVIPVGIHPPENHIWHIPAKIDGERAVGRFFAGGAYKVTIGSPLRFSGDVADWDRVRAVSVQIMQRIIQLSRQSAARVGPETEAAGMPIPALKAGSIGYPMQGPMGTLNGVQGARYPLPQTN